MKRTTYLDKYDFIENQLRNGSCSICNSNLLVIDPPNGLQIGDSVVHGLNCCHCFHEDCLWRHVKKDGDIANTQCPNCEEFFAGPIRSDRVEGIAATFMSKSDGGWIDVEPDEGDHNAEEYAIAHEEYANSVRINVIGPMTADNSNYVLPMDTLMSKVYKAVKKRVGVGFVLTYKNKIIEATDTPTSLDMTPLQKGVVVNAYYTLEEEEL